MVRSARRKLGKDRCRQFHPRLRMRSTTRLVFGSTKCRRLLKKYWRLFARRLKAKKGASVRSRFPKSRGQNQSELRLLLKAEMEKNCRASRCIREPRLDSCFIAGYGIRMGPKQGSS